MCWAADHVGVRADGGGGLETFLNSVWDGSGGCFRMVIFKFTPALFR